MYSMCMHFFRKQFLILLWLAGIYGAFLFTHRMPLQQKQHVLGASSNLVLFVQPESGRDMILSAISAAQKRIDVEMYLLSDEEILASLVAACERGVAVSILLEQHPFGGGNSNQYTMSKLQQTCVHIRWTNPSFPLTHEKAIIIDSAAAFILNQNLTASAFSKNREYNIFDTDPNDVINIERIFAADWNQWTFAQPESHLVVSPNSSREQLTQLVSQATSSIFIETEVLDDPSMIHMLQQKAKTIPVMILLPSLSQLPANEKIAHKLQESGVRIKTMSSPYVHAKLLIVDEKTAYIGSINLTTQSMDENRELGIVISEQDILASLDSYFAFDWERATELRTAK